MKLHLEREPSGQYSTISPLFVNDIYECDVLEDIVREIEGEPVRKWKIDEKTAIPRGTYPVAVTYSPHFKKKLPLIFDVEGFTGVRIHSGNTAKDTEGCLIVGKDGHNGTLLGGSSTPALEALMAKMEAAELRHERIFIIIE